MIDICFILQYFPRQIEFTQMAQCVLSAEDGLNFQESFPRTGMILAHLGSTQTVLQNTAASISAPNQSLL